jgi:uncharacterized protein YkwD
MMKIQRHDILFIIIAALMTLITSGGSMALSRSAYANEATVAEDIQPVMDENAVALYILINEARKNPLATAVSLGMDRQQLLDDLPELENVLVNGLPPLVFNDRLYQTAGDHTREMLANSYYAYESLDDRTVKQRLQDAGYVPVKSDESIGLIFFKNFISAERAVSQIFAKMFKDELSPDWSGPRNILNPDFKDIGIGVSGGLYQFDGVKGNVYLATCDFGYTPEIYELQILQLINQFRARPAAMAENLGLNVAEITAVLPELQPVFLTALPPLDFNGSLYLSANEKISDMLENDYFGYKSPSGITLGDRIWKNGYQAAAWATETLARMSTCDAPVSPECTVPLIFRQMAMSSLRTTGYRDTNLLSEKALDAGFRIIAAESASMGGICGNHVHLTTGDFGAAIMTSAPMIMGLVYSDANNNDLYDAGEERPNVPVTLRVHGKGEALQTVVTNPAGGYATKGLAAGLYRVSVGEDDGLQLKWVRVQTGNIWWAFKIPPEIPLPSVQ